MDNQKIKAVIFDLGNVVVDFDHMIAAGKIYKSCDKSPEEIFNLFFDSGITGLFEEGKISPEDFFTKVKEMLNLKLDYAAFLPIWNEIFFLSPKNLRVQQIAKSLKRGYKTALLSNINILHFEYLKNNFPIFGPFHKIITSYQAGVRKPEPAIYMKTLGMLGVHPEEAFYTDDRPELVDEAGKLGIRGFYFQSAEKLEKDLEAVGINIG